MRLPHVTIKMRWTIVGLAAVTTLIFVMALIILPAIRAALESGQRNACEMNLAQVAIAVRSYCQLHDQFPPATVPGVALPPERRLSWITCVYPFMDVSLGRLLFDRSAPWDSASNRVPTSRMLNFDDGSYTDYKQLSLYPFHSLLCPTNTTGRDSGVTHYVGISGIEPGSSTLPVIHPRCGIFGNDRRTTIADVKDGLAQTMMLAETSEGIGPWIAGGPMTARGLDPMRQPYIGQGRAFGGNHRGGATVAFADGSVRFLSESMDPKVFEALSTIAGGEALPIGWDRGESYHP